MEIKNSLLRNIDPYRNRVEQKPGDAPERAVTGQASATPKGDRVSLSEEARLHIAARSEAAAAPEVRREKVDALKQSVADGTYTVDSRQVAQKLLASESLLAGTLEG